MHNVVRHVLPDTEGFEDWWQATIDRLEHVHALDFFLTGPERAEVASLRYSPIDRADRDLDRRRRTVRVFDKDRGERIVRLDDDTVTALADYLRPRRNQPHAALPWLWLGTKGPINDGGGMGRVLRDRGRQVGIPDLHRLGHGLWVVKTGSSQ